MPIISDQMKKAAKKAAAQEKKRKEEEEHRIREEQAKKEQEEREAKEREEQEKKQKKMEKRQKRKERHDKHKKEKQELEKRANMRKEMALIRRHLGAKQIKDEGMIERQGLGIMRTEIKSGAFSKVYKAKHGDQENIVCKVIILDKTPQPYRQNLPLSLQVQRYVGGGATDNNSTKGGSDPKNAGLVKVIDIFTTDKKAYIFMEEVEPKSLIDAKFKKAEAPDETEVKKALRELAQTLQYLHGIGVAHNNLRPSSVVCNKENQLKLIGMNMCCFYWDSDMETVVPKKRLHKKEYDKNPHLPPEAFKEETYDPSLADVWGFGVLMCLMITKESPFKIKSEQPFDEQWKAFAQTKQFSDEAKQLLDRIFVVEAVNRPNIIEVLEDSYLKAEGNAPPNAKAPASPTDAKAPASPTDASPPPAEGATGPGATGAKGPATDADTANANPSDEPPPKP